MKKILFAAFAITATLAPTATVEAHDGKRMEVVVIDNKLFGQGYLSGDDPTNDGGGIVRPYLNAIHGHFANALNPNTQSAEATLPGFDVFDSTAQTLAGSDLVLTLLGATKWDQPTPQDPSLMGPDRLLQDFEIPDVLPELSATDAPIFIGNASGVVNTSQLGSLTLSGPLSGPAIDLDVSYQIDDRPENILYVLEWQLSTSKVGILPSDSLFTILSPNGNAPNDPVSRLHFQALALERQLGVTLAAIPEPGSISLLAVAGLWGMARRRR